jgi:hypothetical protein
MKGRVALIEAAGKSTGAVHVFDWLPTASSVEVGSDSSVTLAFANGDRYEIGKNSKVLLSAKGPKLGRGTMRLLDHVAPIPRLALTAASNPPGARSGAIRLRGGKPRGIDPMYPLTGTSALPDAVVLRFAPVSGVARYRVGIEDQAGRTIFETDTQSSQVAVPAGTLSAGSHYRWRVETLDSVTAAVCGESEFATLSAQAIEQRVSFKIAVETRGDAESLALLAAIDRSLGLLLEARNEFRDALAKSPTDPALRQITEELKKELLFDW